MSQYDPQSPYGQPNEPQYGQPNADQPHGVPPTHGEFARPSISPSEERTWGMIAHVTAIAAMVFSAGFAGFLGSLVIYVLFKDRGPFVRAHSANSLNVQITMLIWIVVSIPLILVLGLGLLTLFAAPIVAFLLHLVGAIKASQGQWWDPPLTPRFVK